MIYPLALAWLGLASQVSGACPRALLQEATAAYVSAQTSGQPLLLPLAPNSTYFENDISLSISKGVLSTSLHIDINRSLHDTTECSTFTELTAATNKHPYVIHTRMLFSTAEASSGSGPGNAEKLTINTIQSVITDEGDWKWGVIPSSKRDTRVAIKAAADAYLDSWGDSSVKVPYGAPCARLEGGAYTGTKTTTTNTCKMPQFPLPFRITNRRYVVDEEVGGVGVFNDFPFIDKVRPEGTPSSNLLRVEGGGIRYVHELTVCSTKGCGR